MHVYNINDTRDCRRFLFLISSKIFKNEAEIAKKMKELNLSFGQLYTIYAEKSRNEAQEDMNRYLAEHPDTVNFLGELQLKGLNETDK